MIETDLPSETVATTYQSALRYIAEGCNDHVAYFQTKKLQLLKNTKLKQTRQLS
jgi:hypothetical protein